MPESLEFQQFWHILLCRFSRTFVTLLTQCAKTFTNVQEHLQLYNHA